MITTTRKQKAGSAIFESSSGSFINRELSWLEFNSRVLQEAADRDLPLLERLKFIAIFSSNLDEFFMVRVAGLLHLRHNDSDRCDPAGYTPGEQLQAIVKKVSAMLKQQYSLLRQEILPALETQGIFLTGFDRLSSEDRSKMRKFFIRDILPALTPLAADPAQPFPRLNSGALELALRLHFPKSGKDVTAFVEVPEVLGRFFPVPDKKNGTEKIFITAEDLIAANINLLFPGGEVKAIQLFRITRDMDYVIAPEDDAEDLLHNLRDKLRQRSRRDPVRMEYSTNLHDRNLLDYLQKSLKLAPFLIFPVPGFMHLKQFFQLSFAVNRPDLQNKPMLPAEPDFFSRYPTIFDAIKAKKNILLAHPYQSFSPIIRMLEEAADDPEVLAIKQTLYRVSGNSPIIKALQKAAKNGKQVTVLVELKARFDESNNIVWAELLDHAGAHVVYGVPGLKVHSKTLLIVRKEAGKLCKYVHFGTGNYNDETAKLYTDLSLLSCSRALTDDAADLFNLLSGNSEPPEKWKQIAVSPFNLRQTMEHLIENEIKNGKNGRIIAKMNSLSDPQMINLLQRAVDAGVKIDLIVRGICCMRPPEGKKNLRIISIVDRFLEHSRVFFFGTGEKLFCSSADWMPRNLDRRIETAFPIDDPALKQKILAMLNCQLQDKAKSRRLTHSGKYTRPADASGNPARSQLQLGKLFNSGD